MDKSKIYLDLSKCTEEERKHVISLLPKPKFQNQYEITKNEFLLSFDTNNEWWVYVDEYVEEKKELTYPEFIKLFEDGETSAENEEVKLFEENQRRAGIRHAMYLLESFKEDYYSVDAKSLYHSIDVLCDFVRSKGADIEPLNWISKEVLQVENNGWIKILSETDLPKEEDEFWVFENNEVTKTKRKIGIDNNDYWWLNIVTHYQPIIKPLPPKF